MPKLDELLRKIKKIDVDDKFKKGIKDIIKLKKPNKYSWMLTSFGFDGY